VFFSFAAKKGYICDSLRTDSLSLWGGDLRVQNFELRTDELARVPWHESLLFFDQMMVWKELNLLLNDSKIVN